MKEQNVAKLMQLLKPSLVSQAVRKVMQHVKEDAPKDIAFNTVEKRMFFRLQHKPIHYPLWCRTQAPSQSSSDKVCVQWQESGSKYPPVRGRAEVRDWVWPDKDKWHSSSGHEATQNAYDKDMWKRRPYKDTSTRWSRTWKSKENSGDKSNAAATPGGPEEKRLNLNAATFAPRTMNASPPGLEGDEVVLPEGVGTSGTTAAGISDTHKSKSAALEATPAEPTEWDNPDMMSVHLVLQRDSQFSEPYQLTQIRSYSSGWSQQVYLGGYSDPFAAPANCLVPHLLMEHVDAM